MSSFVRMLEDDARDMCYQDYTATMLKLLTQSFIRFAGGDFTAPSFIEMMYPKKTEETAEQIKDHVLSLFQ